MVSFMRIYADASGESHFEDLDVPFEAANFVPPRHLFFSYGSCDLDGSSAHDDPAE